MPWAKSTASGRAFVALCGAASRATRPKTFEPWPSAFERRGGRRTLTDVIRSASDDSQFATRRFSGTLFHQRPSTRCLNSQREDDMARRNHSVRDALLASGMLLVSAPVFAADVTPERLLNPDKEPQNWLMNHRTYDGQRFSPLTRINRDNVK